MNLKQRRVHLRRGWCDRSIAAPKSIPDIHVIHRLEAVVWGLVRLAKRDSITTVSKRWQSGKLQRHQSLMPRKAPWCRKETGRGSRRKFEEGRRTAVAQAAARSVAGDGLPKVSRLGCRSRRRARVPVPGWRKSAFPSRGKATLLERCRGKVDGETRTLRWPPGSRVLRLARGSHPALATETRNLSPFAVQVERSRSRQWGSAAMSAPFCVL